MTEAVAAAAAEVAGQKSFQGTNVSTPTFLSSSLPSSSCFSASPCANSSWRGTQWWRSYWTVAACLVLCALLPDTTLAAVSGGRSRWAAALGRRNRNISQRQGQQEQQLARIILERSNDKTESSYYCRDEERPFCFLIHQHRYDARQSLLASSEQHPPSLNQQQQQQGREQRLLLRSLGNLRGGASSSMEPDEEETSDDDDEDDDEGDRASLGGSSSSSFTEKKEEFRNEADKANDGEEESSPSPTILNREPVLITVKTVLGERTKSSTVTTPESSVSSSAPVSALSFLDQSIEITVHPSRNILSLKQSLQRQLPGKPPIATMQLIFQGRIVPDDVLVDELLEDHNDDDDDDDDDKDSTANKGLVLLLDMIPPVDPKLIAQPKLFDGLLQDLTVSDLLDAYVTNEAALYQNNAALFALQQQEAVASEQSKGIGEDEEGDDEEETNSAKATTPSTSFPPSNLPTTVPLALTRQIKEHAALLRHNLESKLLTDETSRRLLAETRPPSVVASLLSQQDDVRGQRRRPASLVATTSSSVGGLGVTWKRAIQRNLNIQWADTIRHVILFLFFGWFGGRTPFSRAILLLGAPSVILLQARPVKLLLRQLWYLVLDHPPSIVLSLMPAPQQAILDLNVAEAMQTIYGTFAAENRSGRRHGNEEAWSTKAVSDSYRGIDIEEEEEEGGDEDDDDDVDEVDEDDEE